MSRPTQTFILITRDEVIRADLSGRSGVTGLHRMPRPDVPDLTSLVDTALLVGPVARSVWVFCTDFWLQTLDFPASRVKGLGGSELESALGFEVEVNSGLANTVTGFCEVAGRPGERAFLVCQFSADDFLQMEEVVRQAGGTLRGAGHPAAVPVPVGAATADTRRIEFWPDMVVSVGRVHSKLAAQIVHSEPGLGRWRAELEDPAGAQFLVLTGTPDSDNESLDLRTDAQLTTWLEAWAKSLAARKPQAALIRPSAQWVSNGTRTTLSLAFGLLVLAFCMGGHYLLDQGQKAASEEAAQARQQIEEGERIRTGMKTLLQKRAQNQKQAAQIRGDLHRVELQKQRFVRLLPLLAEHRPEHLVIRGMEWKDRELVISGLCLRAEEANRFAASLAGPLREIGWQAGSPRKKSKLAEGGEVVWTFDLTLQEFHLPPAPRDDRNLVLNKGA